MVSAPPPDIPALPVVSAELSSFSTGGWYLADNEPEPSAHQPAPPPSPPSAGG